MNQRLYRSRSDVVWTGVAGGVAEWLRMDPSVVRVLWVILTPFSGGLALLVYLVMWIVVPVAPYDGAGAGAARADVGAVPPAPTEGGAEASPGVPPSSQYVAPPPAAPAPVARREPGNAGVLIGAGLILLGGLFLAREFIPEFRWDFVWPSALILLGVALLVGVGRNR